MLKSLELNRTVLRREYNQKVRLQMWSDKETDIDLFGTTHIKTVVLDIIHNPELLPATIGVFGDWGSGKSSIIKMIASDIAKSSPSNILVLEFNGWLFEGYDDTKAVLMETIVDALAAKIPSENKNLKKIAIRLYRKINWFRVAGKVIQYSAAALATGGAGIIASASQDVFAGIKAISKEISEEKIDQELAEETAASFSKNIRTFRKEFEQLLNETGIDTLIVTIDDLDRCLPNTIIETLEAIKLFLFVPKTAFIIGADERLVKYAVRSRFPELPGDRTDVGRDYLEKLIQYTVRIPAMTRADTGNYIALLLIQSKLGQDDFLKCLEWVLQGETIKEQKTLNADSAGKLLGDISLILDDLAYAERIGPILASGLNGNPRQCKRFLNTLEIRIKMAKSRGISLEKKVLSKIMLLEYFKLTLFKKLAEWQATGNAVPLLKALELPSVSDEGKTEDSISSTDLSIWQQDEWVQKWVAIEPLLNSVELYQYFYFAREALSEYAGQRTRISPAAQEIVDKLNSRSQAQKAVALERLTGLSLADINVIFETFSQKASNAEDNSGEDSQLRTVLDITLKRKEVIGDFLDFISTIPPTEIPVWVVAPVWQFGNDTAYRDIVNTLLDKWGKSGPRLENAIKIARARTVEA